MTPHTVTSQWWDHATLWNADDPTLQDAGHTTDGGRVFGITRVRYDECDHYGCKPVAVVPFEDRKAINHLLSLLADALNWGPHNMQRMSYREPMQAALREFANPTPPRPEEPLGLGAVVEEENGQRWLSVGDASGGAYRWARDGHVTGTWRLYDDIKAVRVLSPGYTGDQS